jgi:hypothetical protein
MRQPGKPFAHHRLNLLIQLIEQVLGLFGASQLSKPLSNAS